MTPATVLPHRDPADGRWKTGDALYLAAAVWFTAIATIVGAIEGAAAGLTAWTDLMKETPDA